MEPIKIEKGMGMPKERPYNHYPFREMEVGDSFTFTGDNGNGTRVPRAAWSWAKHNKLDYKFAVRKISDTEWRIWRIK